MKFPTGIRTSVIVGIVFITVAAMLIISLLSIKVVETNSVWLKVREAESIARLLRAAVMEMDTMAGRKTVVNYARKAREIVPIEGLTFIGSDGGVLFSEGAAGGAGPGKGGGVVVYYEEGIRIRHEGGGLSFILGGSRGVLNVFITRRLAPPAEVAPSISFTVPLTEVDLELAQISRLLLFYSAIYAVTIIVFGVYFLTRTVIGPIRKLEATARSISGGDFGVAAEVEEDNEIGRLADAFNTMAGRLEDEIKRLDAVNRELVETQGELLQSRTLASVGQLAAGLAHEVGNPLGAVRGYMDILIKGGLDEGEESEILERAGREVGRINEILKEFLDFARPPKELPGPVMVNAVVTDAVAVVTGSPEGKSDGVDIELLLQDSLPPAIIDEGKLRQVFVNLIMNAVHAVSGSGGGKVTVTSAASDRIASALGATGGPRRKDDPDFFVSYDRKGTSRFVEVVVSDTGPGIEPEDLGRIFDPFYTTKGERAGTGLGLFVSRGIVQTNGGMIEVRSTPGEGTTFKVVLPAGRDEDTGS